ncbi:class I SAM-dependent methyltransferase [Lentzea sp. BCCO 10_0798]|uniref:Class I SAM-dependent methyltransferase n=1 Tax=Lentzea kristufekii TaxID=3095430 RepID=A0ABU4TJM7_9PSEU|nr:class I SAM-dependent methyltransferase [Lentzea sp. BCCO 10_0798]MDX8048487.1 class I SAM-dependent methyltransferase [Lentzea sp. BCCO 10_0798]
MHKARLHGNAPSGAISHARSYEFFSKVVFTGTRRRIFGRLVDLADIGAGDEVLDVGCGPGYLTALAARAGGRAVGVDVSEPMIAEARRRRAGGNCSFQVGRAEALDLPDASFDVVVSSLALHHIPEQSRATAFAEMFRVLRPGGRVLIADFRPPKGHLATHLVGAAAGEAMRDNPVERIAPMLGDAGFDVAATTKVSWFLHCVRADKTGGVE